MVKKSCKVGETKCQTIRFDTDKAASQIWLNCLRDFRTLEDDKFAVGAEKAFSAGIVAFRDYTFPDIGNISKSRFRCWRQIESLLKKYRYANDKYTDEELENNTHDKYLYEQKFFSTHLPMKPLASLVLKRARKIAREILGKYNPQYTVVASRFGKKSSIGCPYDLAYIDHKLTDVKAFSGTQESWSWFQCEVLKDDALLSRMVSHLGLNPNSPSLQHDALNLVLVPKSWKVHRPITPLTLLMLFYSYGVGEQVENRLADNGLDIKRLQNRHRVLIKKYSMPDNLSHATADLSSASQALISCLLNRVLPREWYVAISKTFVRQTNVNGVRCYTESILPMGNGLTFPVETLVFYVVLKAIAELSKVKGLISVYGDDLIYPSRMHKYVSVIFPMLKFVLNLDKTFVKAPFRESCGSDFYHGADVRPAFLPGGSRSLSRTKYAVWLYKCYNALARRWSEEELPSTFNYILLEIGRLGLTVFRVPPCFPDTAGIKVKDPHDTPCGMWYLNWSPVNSEFFDGSNWFSFQFLSVQPDERVVKTVLPYYWLALKGQTDFLEDDNSSQDYHPGPLDIAPRQALKWHTIKRAVYRKNRNGEWITDVRYKRFVTCPSKKEGRVTILSSIKMVGKARSGSVSYWA